MKNRVILKKHKDKKNIKVIIIFLTIISLLFSIYYVNKRISASLKSYSKIEVDKFLNIIVAELLKDKVLKDIDTDKIIEVYKNNDNDIVYANFNNEEVNKILSDSITLIQNSLVDIENGKTNNLVLPDSIYSKYNKLDEGIIIEVPTGTLINNSLFYNVGPKIPIKVQMLGAVKGNIKTLIKEYGINNSMVNIKMVISITEQLVLPVSTEKIKLEIEIPIATKLIQGKIPTYYQNGLSTNSSIFSLPDS